MTNEDSTNERQSPDSANMLDYLPEVSKTAKATKDTLAIALKYEPGSAEAPHVAASGKGNVAEQILRLAFDHGVKVREDADLAQILATLDVETPIPLEAYAAVAEILAYLYRANHDAKGDTA
jgi:flagellar biosynthesis protein